MGNDCFLFSKEYSRIGRRVPGTLLAVNNDVSADMRVASDLNDTNPVTRTFLFDHA